MTSPARESAAPRFFHAVDKLFHSVEKSAAAPPAPLYISIFSILHS